MCVWKKSFLAGGEAASRALLHNTACHQQTLSVWECVCVCLLVHQWVCFDACVRVGCVQLPELLPIASNLSVDYLASSELRQLLWNLTQWALNVRSLVALTNPVNWQLRNSNVAQHRSCFCVISFHVVCYFVHQWYIWCDKQKSGMVFL